MYSTPTLMSEITQPRSIGITAQAASASTQETSGASRNTPLLEPDGMIGSSSTTSSRTLCATMTISGQRKPVQNELAKKSAIRSRSLRCRQHFPGRQPGTFRHDSGSPRDRVGQIEILDRTLERGLVELAALTRQRIDVAGLARLDLVHPHQMRHGLEQGLAQRLQGIIGQLLAEHIRQRTEDRPVLARLAGRERRAAC